jgi:hypothetical protein
VSYRSSAHELNSEGIDKMTIRVSTPLMAKKSQGQWFQLEASDVLNSLRLRVADVLSTLGNFNRPAEVQKALGLDKTLSRQVFKVAGTAEPLGSSTVVPSRTSMGRFLDAAKDRGIRNETLNDVWDAYEQFEKLVHTHAGDRSTFNTMMSSLAGEDEEWAIADNQHRRNAFRAMSHAIGSQMKTSLRLFIATEIEDGAAYETAMINGCIGLRLLHVQSSVRVAMSSVSYEGREFTVNSEPLGLSALAGGHLLESFSSKPLQKFRVVDGGEPGMTWREIRIEDPEVGNLGSSNLFFGTVCPRVPADGPLNLYMGIGQPTEVLLMDVLVSPGLGGGAKPVGGACLGHNEKFGQEILHLRGKFDPEFLGYGPKSLSTPEVPHYAEMVQAAANKIQRDLSSYVAWRMRVEFPLFHSTVSMRWNAEE